MLPQSVSIRDFYQRIDTKEYQRFVLFARPKWMIRWMDRWCVSTPSPFFLLSFALMLSTTHPCSYNSALGRHVLNSQDECLAWTKVLNRRWPLDTHLLTLGIPQPVEGPLMKKNNGIFLLSPWCFCQCNHAMKPYQRNFSCFLQLLLTNQSSCHLPAKSAACPDPSPRRPWVRPPIRPCTSLPISEYLIVINFHSSVV